YTSLTVADWDGDQLPDVVINSIWGKIEWYRNIGSRSAPKLAAAAPVEVEWPGTPPKPAWNWWDPQGKALVTQWRTTPVAIDFTRDGLTDLVMLDHEGYLCLWERRRVDGKLQLLPGRRAFVNEKGEALQLNAGRAGKSGRRKLCVTDWDGDGKLDVILNSENASLLRQVESRNGRWVMKDEGNLDARPISGHTTSPTTVDWNGDNAPDLLVGAEDGRFYYKRNPRAR
ncbi:MAG: FG-GAP repeat domain-containing protein, partial [Actinomycetota bacterium]